MRHSADLYDCGDFATQFQAQQCFDSCWVVTGRDVHGLDADWDHVACEHLPHELLPWRAWLQVVRGEVRPGDRDCWPAPEVDSVRPEAQAVIGKVKG